MDTRLDLDALTRNTRRLEFEDGLNDLQNGFIFLLLGLLASLFMSTAGITLYMRAILFNEGITIVALIALIPLFYLITFGIRWLIRRYRRDVLWRGLGEIEPFKWQVDTRYSLLATGVWLAVVIVGFILFSGDPMDLNAGMRVLVGAGGIATSVIYYFMGRSLEIGRYRWVGMIGLLLSAATIFIRVPVSLSWIVFGLIWASLLGVSGAYALRNTLRLLREQAT